MQAWGQPQLQALGFTAERAQQLCAWARGECDAAVEERAPPKTLSVQMSLTPVPLKSFLPGDSICGDTEGALGCAGLSIVSCQCVGTACELQLRSTCTTTWLHTLM